MENRNWQEWLGGLSWEPISSREFKQLGRDEQLARIRHSSSHVMATAMQILWPTTNFAVGPATPQGFFYDVRTDQALVAEDLEAIQKEMAKISGRSEPFEVAAVPKADAYAYFKDRGQELKLEILDGIDGDSVTLYRNGEFIDLCAGPHVPHTGLCRHINLLNISAVHWRGEDTPSLTRVNGTAWSSPKDLKRYMEFLDEVKARDHRVLGPQLDMFSFHPWAAAALWHPKGVIFRNGLMEFWRETISRQNYVEILNPLLYRKELFTTSGHWDHFYEDMYIFRDAEGQETFALKPMNCPDTMLYFRSSKRSYRELPMRVAEGQILHRNEPTGSIHGLMRTRNFIQDDAHIFLKADQILSEVQALMEMLDYTYGVFNLPYNVHLSTRPEKSMGEIAVWDEAEKALKDALEKAGVDYVTDAGEGAFYGPKIDFMVEDSLGREWQCGTIQLDFQLPERFDLTFADIDGGLKRPIVIHRALFGSFERFMGILIEHLGGAFPTWLSPVQVAVLPISERHSDYAQKVHDLLKSKGIRVEVMDSETINYRIRSAETGKIPYMVVVGDREAENNTVSVRKYAEGPKKGVKALDDFVTELLTIIRSRQFDVQVKSFSALFRGTPEVSTEDEPY